MAVYSNTMFTSELAKYYDAMREYRDDGKEALFADSLIQKQCPGTGRVLDLCCGTGEHAMKMTELGYQVTGIDLSKDMLAVAVEKAEKAGLSIDFIQGDVNDFKVSTKFKAAYCLGYTLLYMTTHQKAMEFFHSVNKVLEPGGIFVVDFINGWSIADEWHKDKATYRFGDTTIFLSEQATLDRKRRIKHVEFQYLIDDYNGQVKTVFAEEDLRIYFEDEVGLLLSSCGFEKIEYYGDHKLDTDSKNLPEIMIVSGLKKG
ncbi:MAG: class I SAM-dependent methyltransferase [Dehalococcoidales bacterium]|nr:MAG: class I SAM-dependent methyltransferase [Dehalococcoidales bacterium]